MTPAPISVERLRELIAEYWDLAYAEGAESRSHDTPAGDAMRVSAEIDKCIAALLHQLAELQAKTACTLGVGDGSGQLFVHGDYESIKAAQAVIAKLAERDSELSALRQACWDARAVLGFDNDGDPTPDALVYPSLADMVRRDAAEFRKDYDEACNEAHAAERAREEAISIMRTHTRQRRGFVREVVIMDAAAVDAFLAASGGGNDAL